jgi:hypothetical protein
MDSITIACHPGVLTAGELGDLADLAEVMGCKSARYASLLQGWIERESARRSSDEALEPWLAQVAAAQWTDEELAAAAVAAHASYQSADDSSPRVRDFLARVSFVLTIWLGARLTNKGN